MAINSPDNQFRVVMTVWVGNHSGEQSFYSSNKKNLLDAIQLVQELARSPLGAQIRSYKIHEMRGTRTAPRWSQLDYSDWKDLAWPEPKTETS